MPPRVCPPRVCPPRVHFAPHVPHEDRAHGDGQAEELEPEVDHHRGALGLVHGDGVQHEGRVEGHEGGHEEDEAEVCRRGHVALSRLRVDHALGAEPVEDLEEEQRGEQTEQLRAELLAEDGQREARLGDFEAAVLLEHVQLLHAQRTQEPALGYHPRQDRHHQDQIAQDLAARGADVGVAEGGKGVGNAGEEREVRDGVGWSWRGLSVWSSAAGARGCTRLRTHERDGERTMGFAWNHGNAIPR